MKRKRKTLTVAINLVLFFVIIGLIYAALNSSWVHRRIFKIIEERIGWSIIADDISINPFLGIVKVRAANVLSRTKREVFAAEEVYVRVNPFSAIRGKIIVSRLEVRNVYLSFEKRKKKKIGPPKFTLEYIARAARKVAGNFALQNITVESGQIGSVVIMIGRRKGGFVDLKVKDFKFELSQNILRKNDFHFIADDFRIKGNVVSTHLEVDSVLASKRVTFDTLDFERPEGSYSLYLDAHVQKETIGGEIRITANIPKVFREEIKAEGVVKLTPPNLFLETFKIRVGDITLNAPGQMFVPKGNYDIDITMEESPLEAVWAALNIPSLEEIGGRASLKGKLKAKLPALHLTADIDGKDVKYKYFHAPQIHAGVEMSGRKIHWKGAGASFKSQGRVDLEGKPQKLVLKELDIQLQGLALESIMPGGEAAGTANGSMSFKRAESGMHGSGTLSLVGGHIAKVKIDRLHTGFKMAGPNITLDHVRLQLYDKPMLAATRPLVVKLGEKKIMIDGDPLPGLSLSLDYDKAAKIWTLQKLRLEETGRVLNANGFYRANKTFQLHVKGDLNAQHVANMRAYLNDAKGVIGVDLSASGSTSQPQVMGSIRFKGAQLNVRGLGDPIQDLSGRIHISPTQMRLEKITGQHSDGEFHANGTIGIHGIDPTNFNLDLSGSALTFRIRGAMQVDFDANLKVSGAMPSPLVSGRIDLLSGRYYKRFNLAKTVFAERQVPVTRDRFESEFFKDWRWNVEVRNSGDLRIENNMATVFLDGNVRLKGSTQNPLIMGVVTSSGGELHYLGRNLQITEGSLDFRNAIRINPYLSFQAQREIEGAEGRGLRSYYTVYVKVEGPLDNLDTTLWSTPSADKADVISLLAFGVRQSDLSGAGASRRAFATTAIANSLTSGFGADLGDIVGLDILRFESGEGSDQAISGVAVGKNLSDRLSVEFYTDISPDSAQRRVRSKYYLTDNIFLEGANTFKSDRNEFELNVSLQFKIR